MIKNYSFCFVKSIYFTIYISKGMLLLLLLFFITILVMARRVGSDGSMSASGSAGPGFNPRRGGKF